MPPTETRTSYGYYDVVRELGRGSMGTVFLARDRRIGREAALKTIEVSRSQFEDADALEEFYRRLQREAEVSGSIHHPNVVTLFEAGYDDGHISYLAMEYVDGPSLLRVIKSHLPQPIPLELATSVTRDILSGLASAHAKGVIHRDIKPANILLTTEGRAKIADFGIARGQSSSIPVEGSLIGTPDYMSPEQVRGETVTPASDLFALGALLFEMLTARKPFVGDDVTATLYNIAHGPTPMLPESVPVELRVFVERLLSKRPQYRFASASDALDALDDIVAGAKPGVIDGAATIAISGSAEEQSLGEATLASDDTIRLSPPPESAPLLKRDIPGAVTIGVIGAAAAPLVIALVIFMPQIDSSPTVEIPPERLAEYQEKARMMAEAEALCERAEFQACVAAYDAYLERYPTAFAALDGKKAAQAALDEATSGEQVTVQAPEKKKASRWTRFKNRVKGLFHGN